MPLPREVFRLTSPFLLPSHLQLQPCQKSCWYLHNFRHISPKNYQPNSLRYIWNFSQTVHLCCCCNSVISARNHPDIIQVSPLIRVSFTPHYEHSYTSAWGKCLTWSMRVLGCTPLQVNSVLDSSSSVFFHW